MSMYISLPNVANTQLLINLHNSIDNGSIFLRPILTKISERTKGEATMSIQSQTSTTRFLLYWTALIFVIFILVWFLHESAHGFGFWLEGTHVSTGFNLVGASGKAPSDPNFTVELLNQGLTPGLFFGPVITWIMAIAFTVILLYRSQANFLSLIIGATAVSSALMRLIPMIIFIIPALSGSLPNLQDEQSMSLGLVAGVHLPISDAALDQLTNFNPSLFLANPSFYLWFLVSIVISSICLILSYRQLYKLFADQLQSRANKIIFGLIPVILFIPIFGTVTFLDNILRINW